MRKLFPLFTISLVLAAVFVLFVPGGSEAKVTIDPHEVEPGVLLPMKLKDFNSKGDQIELTVVFKDSFTDNFEPRGINILILEESRAVNPRSYESVQIQAIHTSSNVSTLTTIKLENPVDKQLSIIFFNPPQADDDAVPGAWENATVKLRVDYEVKNAPEEEGFNFVPLVLGSIAILLIIVLIIATVLFFKRRNRDAKTFFNPGEGPYFAFRSIIEDKIYYLDPEQYEQLYNSNSFDEYDYLGTATRIGGPITSPDTLGMEAVTSMPMEGQLMMAVPIEGGDPPVDIASLEAMPVAPPPVADFSDGEVINEQILDGPVKQDPYGQYQQDITQDVPFSGEPVVQTPDEGVGAEQQNQVVEQPPENVDPNPQEEPSSQINGDENPINTGVTSEETSQNE